MTISSGKEKGRRSAIVLAILGGAMVWSVPLYADAAAAETRITPTDQAEMVLIPAGTFVMGAHGDTQDASPAHVVTLPTFYIDRTEVTNARYALYIADTGVPSPPNWPGPTPPKGTENRPVTNITWFEAMDFATWAGKRLPTEAEWEKAARGTDGRRYPWGDVDDEKKRNLNLRSPDHLESVGCYPSGASPYGALDLIGNAWEWTADWYQSYPGSHDASVHYGRKYKVVRGPGAEYIIGVPHEADTTIRARMLPYGYDRFVGFRCAMNADEVAPNVPIESVEDARSVLKAFEREPRQLVFEREFQRLVTSRSVPLRIDGPLDGQGIVRGGIPLPEGWIHDPASLRLVDADGRTRTCQRRVLSRWPDGSCRWILLDAEVPSDRRLGLQLDAHVEPAPVPRHKFRVDHANETVSVDTGSAVFRFNRESLISIALNDDPDNRLGPFLTGWQTRTSEGERRLRFGPADVLMVDEEGPLRAVVRCQGSLQDDSGQPSGMRYDLRAHVTVGSTRLRLLCTFTHAVPRSSHEAAVREPILHAEEVLVRFALPAPAGSIRVPREDGTFLDLDSSEIDVTQIDDLRYVITQKDQVHAEGSHAPGWLAVETDHGWWRVGMRHYSRQHPCALMVNRDSIGVRLYAGDKPFEFDATLAKTWELIVDYVEAPDEPFALQPLRLIAPPAWVCGTRAIGGPLLPRDEEALSRFPYWELLRESSMRQLVKGMPTGLRDYGDAYMGGPYKGRNAYLNLEYDVPFNYLLQFLRTGEAWYLDTAEVMARHQADIDTDHVTGQPYKHSPLHTTTRADIAHMFNRGLLLHYLLTGESRSLEVATSIGDHIAERTLRLDGYGNERQIGWGLYALTGLYEVTGEKKYLDAAEHLCLHLALEQSPTGRLNIRYDNRYVFMNGIAMNGMLSVYKHTEDERIAECVQRLARRSLGHYPEYACRTLNAFCHVLADTKDPRYLDVLERTWETSMDYLKSGVSVATHGWQFTYFAAKHDLFPLFEVPPEQHLEPASYRGLRLENGMVELYLRRAEDAPAAVLLILNGHAAGSAELHDLDGTLIERVEFDRCHSQFQPRWIVLGSEHRIGRLRLIASTGLRAWEIHADGRSRLTLADPAGVHLPTLHPRAYGFVQHGSEKVRFRLICEGEGYHLARLYDQAGRLRATVRRFVEFEDPGRFVMDLEAAVSPESWGKVWGVEIFDAEVKTCKGMLPYWAATPEELFNPEHSTRVTE